MLKNEENLSPQNIVRVKFRGKWVSKKPFFKASSFEILKPLKSPKPFFFKADLGRPQFPSLLKISHSEIQKFEQLRPLFFTLRPFRRKFSEPRKKTEI